MKILWISNSPHTKTAYGNNTRNIILRLKDKHDFIVFAFYGLDRGTMMNFGGIPVLARNQDGLGRDILPLHLKKIKPDLVIAHYDAWASPWLGDICHQAKIKLLYYSPWDMEGETLPWAQSLKKADYVVPFCEFAKTQMLKAGLKNLLPIIPHGVDTEIFKPRNKTQAREVLKIDTDSFLILMIAANRDKEFRKGWDVAFEGIKRFIEANPRVNTRVYIHSEYNSPSGINLILISRLFGIDKKITYTDPYHFYVGGISDEKIAQMYNAADCLIMPSSREGFGIPILEAAASGIPPIVTDFSSMSDLGFDKLKIKIKGKRLTCLGGYTAIVDSEDLAKKIRYVYKKGYPQRVLRKRAMEFDWNKIIPLWRDCLDKIT